MMDGYIDQLALEAARAIDDEFAKGHFGVAQRKAAVQGIVAEAIKQALRQAIENLHVTVGPTTKT